MAKTYQVRQTSDAVGYYVVKMLGDIEMEIIANSYSKKEMLDLARQLNEEMTNGK